ncbi:hypothetical protein [Thiolapillus brandeum]|uniref:Uncharacterized protein n=1 Tax=Thiolapillus brandeum TaxID=1076588 RepID=A0A7U6GIU8_9GAMM|nr:hypothetical protein [Thiolapillus brandeum]BAO44476.1 hypothetical protein TBH_C1558 [Thiolapillus brandeum]
MKFIIIYSMHGFPRKLVVLILSLMLALVPLQGLFASEMSMHASQQTAQTMPAAMEHTQMSMMDAATDCTDCTEETRCCTGNSCNIHQCASCVVMAFLPGSFVFQPPESEDVPGTQLPGNPASTSTSLYRPPQV